MDKTTNTLKVSIRTSLIVLSLGSIALFLILTSIGGLIMKYLLGHPTVKGLVPLFDLNREGNIPTFYSALLLFFAALIILFISILSRKQKSRYTSRWTFLSFVFLYLAFDEGCSFHEKLVPYVMNLLGNAYTGIGFDGWVIPYSAGILLLALYLMRFWLHLPRKTRLLFLMAAVVYIAGAIGTELVDGYLSELYGFENLTVQLVTNIEESLELAGVIVFIKALLEYIADHYVEILLRFEISKAETL